MGPNFTQCKFDVFLQTLHLIGNAEIHVFVESKKCLGIVQCFLLIFFWEIIFINDLPVY